MANIFGFNLQKTKSKTRSQMCLIITDDKRVIDHEIPVRVGCCVDDAYCCGWLLDGTNQMQSEENAYQYQILSERSTIPICINNKWSLSTTLATLIDSLFHESWVNDLVTMARDNREDKNKGWIVLLFGVTIVLVLLILSAKAFRIGG